MLKERGSGLGETLETAATDFLSDVKKKEVKQVAGYGERTAGGASGGIAAILTAGVPEYDPANDDDAGSSFEEGSSADSGGEGNEEFEWEVGEQQVGASSSPKVPATASSAGPVPPPPPTPTSPSAGGRDDNCDDSDDCRVADRGRGENNHARKEDTMEQLDKVTEEEEEEEEERLDVPENPVPQIPALVRIPLCPPPIPLISPPPVPSDDLSGVGNDDLSGEMWARARRRSSAATGASASASASAAARKDSSVSSSEEGGGIAELVRKSSSVLGQLIRVDDATATHDTDLSDDEHWSDGARRPDGESLLSEASTRLSGLSVGEASASGVSNIASPSFSALEGHPPGREDAVRGQCVRAGAELLGEEGETIPATAALTLQKRVTLRASTGKARKKSTLASKWRRQRERQRSREPSPPSPESPPPSPFDNVTQGLSTVN